MNVLGLHFGHDASAAVIKDNRLVSLIARERLTRVKYDRGFLPAMVDEALSIAKLKFIDIDYVALSLSSGGDMEPKIRPSDFWGITVRKDGKDYRKGPRQLDPWECEDGLEVIYGGVKKPAYHVQHHIAHAASSYYTSSFSNAISLSYDGSGRPAEQTSLVCKCNGTNVFSSGVPNINAALMYGVISESMLGRWHDSGKLMGLAAYGIPEYINDTCIEDMTIDGMFSYINRHFPEPTLMREKYLESWKSKECVNTAASVQKYMQENINLVLEFLESEGKVENVVLSGGGALNVICNRSLTDRYNVFAPPFVKDDGLSAGAALYILHHVHGAKREKYCSHDLAFLGGDKYRFDVGVMNIAEDLAQGKVVLWHQSRSEAGPRALTHRSIIADARFPAIKKRVSMQIKGREEYRPLAPIVPADDCQDWFDVKPSVMTEFMLSNARVLSDKIPGVTHVDGTARVQTITADFNFQIWSILKKFKELTGIPVLVNTSLNIQGQAICETEEDTLWTFENCDAEVAVINGRVYRK
jgi:carbamoyltransferase